jgi:tripartite-type tricarboxylate transporter receptor subunit TctC
LPQISAGNLKAYAVMAPKRLAAAPDIPTIDEAGLPGFHVPYWFGLWAPKGTPASIVGKLNAAVVEALADETVRGRLTELGREIVARDQQTPEALGALQRAEIAKWWPIIKAAGIKAE